VFMKTGYGKAIVKVEEREKHACFEETEVAAGWCRIVLKQVYLGNNERFYLFKYGAYWYAFKWHNERNVTYWHAAKTLRELRQEYDAIPF